MRVVVVVVAAKVVTMMTNVATEMDKVVATTVNAVDTATTVLPVGSIS